jgi:polygalacturonase
VPRSLSRRDTLKLGAAAAAAVPLASAAAAALAGPAAAAPAPARSGGLPAASTGTVVVARPDARGVVTVVGTSTVTVTGGATVRQLLAQIVAKDRSRQTYTVADASGQPKPSGALAAGDSLVVVAEDGQSQFGYGIAIFDPGAQQRDGVYWNERLYNHIDAAVNASTPVFRNVRYDINDQKYAGLVRQITDGAGSAAPVTVWYYGDAINAAIAECHARDGGIVVVPATGSLNGSGVYYSGAIRLRSGVNLYLEDGATVKFVGNPTNDFYPAVLTSREGTDAYNYSPMVYALGQSNMAITGGGTLDAQDNVFPWSLPLPSPVPGAPLGTDTVLNDLNYTGVPVEQRIFTDDGHLPATIPVIQGGVVKEVPPPAGVVAYQSTFTPNFVEFNHCANILIEGIQLRNTLFWQVHPLNSRNILIRDTDVNDTAHLTDDGIDPESCDYVVVERNSITVLDDGIAVKSGRNRDGRTLRQPGQRMIIRGNTFYNPSGGSGSISTGSEMSGGIYNVFAENNTCGGPGTAYLLKVKTNAYRGGAVRDIYVRNSVITQTIRGIANFDYNYKEAVPIPNADIFNPTFQNIYLDNVSAAPSVTTSYPAFVIFSDVSRSPMTGVHYRNSVFYTSSTFPAAFSAASAKFFKDLVIDNVTFINPATQAQVTYNATSPQLTGDTTATVGGQVVPLTADTIADPNVIVALAQDSFTVSGQVDLAASAGFLPGGTVLVYVDRDTTAVPVTLNADGSFSTGVITLTNDEYWYVDRHYVAVNFYNGLDINTLVYQVAGP